MVSHLFATMRNIQGIALLKRRRPKDSLIGDCRWPVCGSRSSRSARLSPPRSRRTVTEMDNMLFSSLTLNPQPLHIDRHFCATETEWGQPLMNSLFTLGLMIGISVNDTTVGTTIANLGMTDVQFPTPAVPGRHRARRRPRSRPSGNRKSRPDAGIVEFEHSAFKQDGTLVAAAAARPSCASGRRLTALAALRPGRQRAEAREGPWRSGADALILDLEDSVAPAGKDAARRTRRAIPRGRSAATGRALRPHQPAGERPRRRRSRRHRSGPAGRHHAAEGRRRRRTSLSAQARRARGSLASRTAATRIIAIATETAAAMFALGTYAGASTALAALTWGAEDLSARSAPGQPRRRGPADRPLPPRPHPVPARRRGPPASRRSTPSITDFRDLDGLGANARRRARRLLRQARHPPRPGARSSTRFTPSRAASPSAQAIVAAFAASRDAGVVAIGGRMHDMPHRRRAEQLIARAARYASGP